jgi:hypothetical protein
VLNWRKVKRVCSGARSSARLVSQSPVISHYRNSNSSAARAATSPALRLTQIPITIHLQFRRTGVIDVLTAVITAKGESIMTSTPETGTYPVDFDPASNASATVITNGTFEFVALPFDGYLYTSGTAVARTPCLEIRLVFETRGKSQRSGGPQRAQNCCRSF